MYKHNHISIITKGLTNELGAEEAKNFEALKASDAEFKALYDDMATVWENTGDYTPDFSFDAEAAFDKFATDHDLPYDKTPQIDAQPANSSLLSSKFALFGIVALLILSSSLAFFLLNSNTTISNDSNSRKEMLVDGINTTLSPGTNLTLDRESGKMIDVEGDIFLKVTNDESIVLNDVSIEATDADIVLSKSEKGKLSINVLNGSAIATIDNKSYNLDKDTQLSYSSMDSEPIISSLNLYSNEVLWTKGRLSFNKTSIKQVFADMEHFFNIKIDIQGELPVDCHFTAPIIDDANPKTVFQLLHASFNYKLRQTGDTAYTISSINCK